MLTTPSYQDSSHAQLERIIGDLKRGTKGRYRLRHTRHLLTIGASWRT